MSYKILIVDDSKLDMILISSILEEHEVLEAYDGLECMEVLNKNKNIDIIILDLKMPRMNGFEVLEMKRNNPEIKDIPVIILTCMDEVENEIRGLDLGAVDYIRKPLNLASLRKRVEVHIALRMTQKALEEQNKSLEEKVKIRTLELELIYDKTVQALMGLLEVRDIESGNHIKRTQILMRLLCEGLKKLPEYEHVMSDNYIDEIYKTAPLHDIGKVGVPDKILLKPGKLDADEYEQMKLHTVYGVNALKGENPQKESISFINTAIEIVGTHHEKYDGTGYPKGLKGDEIPLPGRLMAIIDVYDALVHERIYKPAYEREHALQIIKAESGKHFDPVITRVFLEIEKEFHQCNVEVKKLC